MDTSGTSVSVELPARAKYYWRVAARDEDGELSDFSKPEAMDAPPPPAPVVVKPVPQPPAAAAAREMLLARSPGESWLPLRFGLGASLYHSSLDLRASDFELDAPGNFARPEIFFSRPRKDSDLTFRFWVSTYKYNEQAGGTSQRLDRMLPGGDIIWRGSRYFLAGVRAQGIADFRRDSGDALHLAAIPVASLLVGPRYEHPLGRHAVLTAEIIMEGAPVGQLRGVSGEAALAVGLKKIWGGLEPSIRVGYAVSRWKVDPSGRRYSIGEARINLALAWEFSAAPSRRAVAEPVAPAGVN
jgi:hypothetical protein